MSIKKLLKEDLSRDDKSEIKSMIEDEIKSYAESSDNEDIIKDVTTEVIQRLFKTLWDRRTSWRGGLK